MTTEASQPTTVQVKVTLNGAEQEAAVEPRLLLVHFIRETLNLTGTHIGCDTTHCGACTVLFGRKAGKVLHHFCRSGQRTGYKDG